MAHSTRPTLPPLHSLNLPRGDMPPRVHESYDLDGLTPRIPQLHIPSRTLLQGQPLRLPSPTSPQTPSSPIPCLRPCTNTPASTPSPTLPFPARKIRLVPTTFENADAVVVVTPPDASNASPPQTLLLVGPALQRLRQRQRQLTKGARVHPYRIVRPFDRRPQPGPAHTSQA